MRSKWVRSKILAQKGLVFTFLIVFLLSFLPFVGFAKIVAKPTENVYVFDYANLIDDVYEDKMREMAKEIEDKTKAEIVVVTVDTLGSYTIEQYALELFRKWGIGDKEKNNGVLILVNKENLLANKKGRIRIEVGYGLEGAITDGKAGRILDTYALPAFEKKDYSRGIVDTFFAVVSEVAKEYNLSIDELNGYGIDQTFTENNVNTYSEKKISVGNIILIIFIFIIVFAASRNGRRNNRWRGPWGGSGGGFGGGSGGGFGGFGGGSSGGGGASR